MVDTTLTWMHSASYDWWKLGVLSGHHLGDFFGCLRNCFTLWLLLQKEHLANRQTMQVLYFIFVCITYIYISACSKKFNTENSLQLQKIVWKITAIYLDLNSFVFGFWCRNLKKVSVQTCILYVYVLRCTGLSQSHKLPYV